MKNKLLALLLKNKSMIFTGLFLSLSAFLIYLIFVYTPSYSTKTKLFVRNIQKNDIVTPYDGGSTVYSESGFSNPLFNLTQILDSEQLSAKVYDILKNKYPDDLNKMGVKNSQDFYPVFSKLIKSKIEPSTDIIKVSFKWENKNTVADVMNEILSSFKLFNLEIRKSAETKQREYLEGQTSSISNQLGNVRKQIKNYKLANKAVNITDESTELTRTRIELEKQASILRSEIAFNRSKMGNLAAQLGVSGAREGLRATGIGEDAYLGKLHQDLASAQQSYNSLQAKFTDNYPDVIAVKNEMESIKNNIKERETETLGSIGIKRGIYDRASQDIVTDLSRAQADNASLKSQLSALSRGISSVASQENQIPAKVLGLGELQKQEDALLSAYTSAKQKLMEAKIKENQVIDNIVPLGQPTKPELAMDGIVMKFIGLMMLGLLGSLAIAYIKEGIADRWISSQEIQDMTGKKILGSLPWIKSFSDMPISYIQRPDSMMGLAYANITSKIISSSHQEESHALTFISTSASREKSQIIPNIAINLAKHGKTAIIIDTNFNMPSRILKDFGKDFHSKNKIDILDVIKEINKHYRFTKSIDNEFIGNVLQDAIIPVHIVKNSENPDFYYLGAAKKSDNIYDYVASRGFKAMIDFLKYHYEFVLLDTPERPFVYPEVTAIANSSDGVIVLSSMQNNRQDLLSLIHNVEKSDSKIFGIISREENSDLERYFIADGSDLELKQPV